jgi:hypothetical protein
MSAIFRPHHQYRCDTGLIAGHEDRRGTLCANANAATMLIVTLNSAPSAGSGSQAAQLNFWRGSAWKLVKGEVVERASEFWRIIQIHTTIGISEPKPIDIVKVFLAGPV